MKKIVLLITLSIAVFSVSSVKAQVFGSNERYSEYLWHVSVGAEGLYNINPGTNYYTGGGGATIKGQYDVTQNLGVTLSTGYYYVKADTRTNRSVNSADFKYIPLKIGTKAYFLPEAYFGAEIGVGYADPSLEREADKDVSLRTGSHFSKVIAPAIGYETNHFDASLRYENINHQNHYKSFIGIRLAYIFNL
jgi:hypothetical protein